MNRQALAVFVSLLFSTLIVTSVFGTAHNVEASTRAQTVDPTPQPSGARTATIREIVNQVLSRITETHSESSATVGQVIRVGGTVQTLADGKARVDLSEGTIVRLAPQTIFTVTQLNQDSSNPLTRLRLLAGKIWVILNGGTLDVDTPVGAASVRGSLMSVAYNPSLGIAIITCLEGTCAVTVNGVTIVLHDHQQTNTGNMIIIKISDKELLDWSANNPESNRFMPPPSGLNDLNFDNQTPLVPCPQRTTGGGKFQILSALFSRPHAECPTPQ
jgi:hypothetical protein